jgi:hypothetical protein
MVFPLLRNVQSLISLAHQERKSHLLLEDAFVYRELAKWNKHLRISRKSHNVLAQQLLSVHSQFTGDTPISSKLLKAATLNARRDPEAFLHPPPVG